jgi:hypothetical protein
MPRGDTVIGFAVGIEAHSRPEASRPPTPFHSGFRANGCHWPDVRQLCPYSSQLNRTPIIGHC